MNSVKEPKKIYQNWLKIRTVTISWNKPSKGQVEEKLIKSKVNKVLSFVGNLIENILTNTSASVETYSCSYRIHDRKIYTLITH